jgi:hypothetical protein
MRAWIKRGLVGVSAVLGILVYSMQFKKACEDASPSACVMSLVGWVGQGILTPRNAASKTPEKLPSEAAKTPDAIKKAVVEAPKTPPASKTSRPSGTGIAPVSNDNRDRRVVVANEGNVTLDSVYATSCASRNWGEDLLGTQILAVGQSKMLTFDDGSGTCCFDLRAKFHNGVQRTNMNVDVCRISKWTVDNR